MYSNPVTLRAGPSRRNKLPARENGKKSKATCSIHSLLVRIGSRENRLDNEARLHIVVYIYAARHKSSFNSHSELNISGTYM